MSKIGRFDTDTAALEARNAAHRRYSTGDMTGWALELLGAEAGDRVLELGAGTGQQTLRLAPQVASVLAVDAAPESLAVIDEAGLPNVRTLAGRFDDLVGRDCDGGFDRALSCYALYYAEDQERLIGRIHELLKPGGTLFFCGPSQANNRELRELHFGLKGEPIPGKTPAQRFMEDDAPRWCEARFSSVERFEFTDEMRFDSAEGLIGYWSSYNLYEPELEDRFRAAAKAHFADHDVFVSAKRVVGIRAVK
ncbi:MAG TPA: class I SAM-dependent methyltransferase [Capillimicrobium sp.]|nr:class I SAM-dependent methyltransferase [Capillimicrobium sp.]